MLAREGGQQTRTRTQAHTAAFEASYISKCRGQRQDPGYVHLLPIVGVVALHAIPTPTMCGKQREEVGEELVHE